MSIMNKGFEIYQSREFFYYNIILVVTFYALCFIQVTI